MNPYAQRLLLGMASVALAGCAAMTAPEPVQKTVDLKNARVVGMNVDDPTEVFLPAEDAFIFRSAETSERLPDKMISNINMNELSVTDAMQLLLNGTGISLTVLGANKVADAYGSVTVYGLSGNLPDVMEKLSNSIGFYYTYQDKTLTISNDRQFLVTLPPAIAEDTYAGITNTIQNIGGHSIFLDRLARTLMFRANRTGFERVDRFLKHVRETRVMIVYDATIYQVDLNDSDQLGIAWSNLNASGTSAITGGAAITGGVSTAFKFVSKNLTQQILVSFLSSYGTVIRVAQPRLTVLMGGKGFFRQGESRTYVSKVGQNIGATVNSVSVETANLNTGLEMSINGDVDGGTVYSRVNLKITDLLTLTPFTALGTELSLPSTAERELTTEVRSAVGDSILLGGILVNRTDDLITGVPGAGRNLKLPISNKKTGLKSELVLVLTPRVIRFVPKVEKVVSIPAHLQAPVVQKPAVIAEPPTKIVSAERDSVAQAMAKIKDILAGALSRTPSEQEPLPTTVESASTSQRVPLLPGRPDNRTSNSTTVASRSKSPASVSMPVAAPQPEIKVDLKKNITMAGPVEAPPIVLAPPRSTGTVAVWRRSQDQAVASREASQERARKLARGEPESWAPVKLKTAIDFNLSPTRTIDTPSVATVTTETGLHTAPTSLAGRSDVEGAKQAPPTIADGGNWTTVFSKMVGLSNTEQAPAPALRAPVQIAEPREVPELETPVQQQRRTWESSR